MKESEFKQLTQIKNIHELSEEVVDEYAQIFLDKIDEQNESEYTSSYFWCPKCESPDALVEVDDLNQKGVASCPNCRMSVILVHGQDGELEEWDDAWDDDDEEELE